MRTASETEHPYSCDGPLADAADQTAATLGNLQSRIDEILTQNPAFVGMLSDVLDLIVELGTTVAEVFSSLSPILRVVTSGLSAVAQAIGTIGDVVSTVLGPISDLVGSLSELKSIAGALFGGIGGFLVGGPMGALIGGGAGLVGGLVQDLSGAAAEGAAVDNQVADSVQALAKAEGRRASQDAMRRLGHELDGRAFQVSAFEGGP